MKDGNYYKAISHDPTHEHIKIINNTIETFHHQQVLAKDIADNLKTANLKLSHFYITPKAQTPQIC